MWRGKYWIGRGIFRVRNSISEYDRMVDWGTRLFILEIERIFLYI